MQDYNQFQVKQLTKLIEVTRTDLKKEDRQKVMNMITIDAHSRDMVESIAESGADRCVEPLYACVMQLLISILVSKQATMGDTCLLCATCDLCSQQPQLRVLHP